MPDRPRYHVTAPRHWLNDPNGPLYWDGRWHLFFQHNPRAPVWGPPQWGHVSSSDLVTWQRHPVALAPSSAGSDRDGCWSGCARVVDGIPTIYYTGVVGDTDDMRVESVMRARSSGDLVDWEKDPTPILAGPPAGADTGFHRDPFIFRDGDDEYLLLGSAIDTEDGRVGAVLAYRETSDGGWAYEGVLFDGRAEWPLDTGPLWECPQLLRFDEGDVLIVSVQDPSHDARPLRQAVAFVGRFADGRFRAEHVEPVDRGDLYYAPAATTGDGRTLIWGWIQDPRPDLGPANPSCRVGALSLPREVGLTDGRLTLTPTRDLMLLRATATTSGQRSAHFDADSVTVDLPAHAEATLQLAGAGLVTVELGPSWHGDTAEVLLNSASEPTDVRIFVDGDIVEVFATDHPPFTTRLASEPRLVVHAVSRVSITDVTIHEITTEAITDA